MANQATSERLKRLKKDLEKETARRKMAEQSRKLSEERCKTLLTELHRARRMEIIGMLAGRIAHKFSNILGAIIGCTELSLLNIEKNSKVYRHLTEVLRAGNRAKNLVEQILTISRHKEQDLKPIRVSPIIREVIKSLNASLPGTIEIKQYIETDSDIVQAIPAQIHHVLMNLCTNAQNALDEGGGELEVGLKEVKIDGEAMTLYPELDRGTYLQISVRDTGSGMDRKLVNHISDPDLIFKESVDGGGLGLAVIQAIVRDCGGILTVDSEPGAGTTFFVHLPKFPGFCV